MKGKCLFCGHPKSDHYMPKKVRPDGSKGGPRTIGCAKCICRKYES